MPRIRKTNSEQRAAKRAKKEAEEKQPAAEQKATISLASSATSASPAPSEPPAPASAPNPATITTAGHPDADVGTYAEATDTDLSIALDGGIPKSIEMQKYKITDTENRIKEIEDNIQKGLIEGSDYSDILVALKQSHLDAKRELKRLEQAAAEQQNATISPASSATLAPPPPQPNVVPIMEQQQTQHTATVTAAANLEAGSAAGDATDTEMLETIISKESIIRMDEETIQNSTAAIEAEEAKESPNLEIILSHQLAIRDAKLRLAEIANTTPSEAAPAPSSATINTSANQAAATISIEPTPVVATMSIGSDEDEDEEDENKADPEVASIIAADKDYNKKLNENASKIYKSMYGNQKDYVEPVIDEKTGKTTYTFKTEEERKKFAIEYANQHPGEPFTMTDENGAVLFHSDGLVLHERHVDTHIIGANTISWSLVPTASAIKDIDSYIVTDAQTQKKEEIQVFISTLTPQSLKNAQYLEDQKKQFLDYAKEHPNKHFEVHSGSKTGEVLFFADGKGKFYSVTDNKIIELSKLTQDTAKKTSTPVIATVSTMSNQPDTKKSKSLTQTEQEENDVKTNYDGIAANINKTAAGTPDHTNEYDKEHDRALTSTNRPQ